MCNPGATTRPVLLPEPGVGGGLGPSPVACCVAIGGGLASIATARACRARAHLRVYVRDDVFTQPEESLQNVNEANTRYLRHAMYIHVRLMNGADKRLLTIHCRWILDGFSILVPCGAYACIHAHIFLYVCMYVCMYMYMYMYIYIYIYIYTYIF